MRRSVSRAGVRSNCTPARGDNGRVRILLALLISMSFGALRAQPSAAISPAAPLDYVCPMDKDVRSDKPGVCPRCGMKLVLGIPDDVEYPLELKIRPPVFQAGEKVQLKFRIADPHSGKTVDNFEVVHEKLF